MEKAVSKTAGFVRDPRRTELIRVLPLAREKGEVYKLQEALDFAKQTVGGDENFHKVSNKQAQRRIILHFHFPEKAHVEHQESVREIAKMTGWSVELSSQANQQKLDEVATELSREAGFVVDKVSVFPNEPRVRVKGAAAEDWDEDRRVKLEEAFLERTGRSLEVVSAGSGPVNLSSSPALAPEGERLEQNQAFALVQATFEELGVRLYRCGRKEGPKGSSLELAFISPEVGDRHEDVIRGLEKATGWPLTVRRQPNPIAIAEVTKETVPPSWGFTGNPSFFKEEGLVRIQVRRRPARAEEETVQKAFLKLTGYRLQLKV